jgi:thymidylate synthase
MEGNIPVLMVRGKNLTETWEKSLIELWEKGISIKTQYDREGDLPSKDCTMIMVIEDPMAEPRIHKAIPGGLGDLEVYRQEFLYGIHDSWIDINDPAKWKYTYHERLFSYEVDGKTIDQINSYLIPAIAEVPYSRRVQAVTWQAWLDQTIADPPCLQ